MRVILIGKRGVFKGIKTYEAKISDSVQTVTCNKDITGFQGNIEESASAANRQCRTKIQTEIQCIQMGHAVALEMLFKAPFVRAE